MKVFVSYALADRKWVCRFAACLRAFGAEVNSWGSSFHLGGDFDEMLSRRMATIDFVVLVLSEGFLAHGHILNELGTAKLIGKSITSVLIEPGGDAPEAVGESAAAAARQVRDYHAAWQRAGS